jgi:subtilase family serine protease
VPTNAVLASGGSILRITISNAANSDYSGPIVIAIGGDIPQQEQVVNVSLKANGGTAVVEFELSPPVSQAGKRAVVTVDPANIVREQREDNNSATFVLQAPREEPPDLEITAATVTASTIEVTIRNDGGRMPEATVVIQVQLGRQTTSNSVNIALDKGESSPVIAVARPTGSGQATVTVYVANQLMASTTIQLP